MNGALERLGLIADPAGAPKGPSEPRKLIARTYNSGFPEAHDTYNGISAASDGKIYYVLSTEKFDVSARMFSFDPATQEVKPLGDITEACGEKDKKTIVQGKSHVPFAECKGKLYFATHIGYYSIIDGMEKMGIPPAGWKPYPGGHLLAYDMASGKFEDLAIAPEREGILTMNMDCVRGRIFGLTWPTGRFFRFDLAKKDLKDFGGVNEAGENGKGATYRTICRSIAVNPDDGSAYFTVGTGAILRYRADRDALETIQGEDLKKDYFGLYDSTSPGHMGYNWRQVFWRPPTRWSTASTATPGTSSALTRGPCAWRCWSGSPRSHPSGAACSTSSATATSASLSGPTGARSTTSPAARSTLTASGSPARPPPPWAKPRGWRTCTW